MSQIFEKDVHGYNLGTPVLKPYKQEIKQHQKDTILKEKQRKTGLATNWKKSSNSTREHNLLYMAGSLLDYLLYLHYINVCRFCCHEFTLEEIE